MFVRLDDHNRLVVGISCLSLLIAGLNSGCHDRPARIPAPGWDPEQISSQAVEQLDANDDSLIDVEEAKKAPGLASSFARIDTNSDSQLSEDEVRARIQLYARLGTGLLSQTFQIVLNGRPFANGHVKFVPEEFLSEVIKSAEGESDGNGVVAPQTVEQAIPAMQVGFYRVHLYESAGSETILTNNLVGVEISPVSTETEAGTPVLKFLKK